MRSLRWSSVLAVLGLTGLLCLLLSPSGKADPLNEKAKLLDAKVVEEVKARSRLMANLTHLSDVIGPRLTGSANLKKANEWAAEQMKSYGLSNVRLEPWTIPQAWERGTATARLLEPSNGRTLTVASWGWTPGTKGKIVGDVVIIKATNREELKAYEGKLKNAIVLRGAPANVRPVTDMGGIFGQDKPQGGKPDAKPGEKPGAQGGKPPFRPGNFGERLAFQNELRDFLKKEGIAAMLQDSGKPHGLLNMSGGWRGNDRGGAASEQDTTANLVVSHDHYAMLYRLASRPAPAVTRLELEVTNTFIQGPVTVYNTIGEIPGSEKPDEFVVVGAHIDSWDLGQGTTDNGTGTCVVLETARAIMASGIKPRRTIRFCLFSGEEQGLYGSRAFVQAHKEDMTKTSAALVHDTGTGRVVALGLQGREVIRPILEAELGSLKDLGVKEINLRGMGGSDHVSFNSAGVPGFMFSQDPAEYRLTHHSQSDTLDKAREPDLIQGAQVMAITALRVANLPVLLPRDKAEGAGGRRGGRGGDKP